MRVGVFIHSMLGGGAEAVATQWVEILARDGHEVVLVTYVDAEPIPSGVTESVFLDADTAFKRWVMLPIQLRKVAKTHRLDVILSVLAFSNLAAVTASLRSRIPVVISEHSVATVMWRGAGGRSGLVKETLARRLYRHADAAIAVSHAVAADLQGHYRVDGDRIYVVPNTVRAAPESVRHRAATGERRVLLVGRCVPEKNFAAAIEAAGLLREQGDLFTLALVGDGPARSELIAKAESVGVPMQCYGWATEWREHAQAGDVLVLPSPVEGLGNVLIEAAAAGIPTVASSRALGVADAMIPNVTGVLAVSNRPVDLADAILQASRLVVAGDHVEAWLARFAAPTVSGMLDSILRRAGGVS